jgi:hypothetical protein
MACQRWRLQRAVPAVSGCWGRCGRAGAASAARRELNGGNAAAPQRALAASSQRASTALQQQPRPLAHLAGGQRRPGRGARAHSSWRPHVLQLIACCRAEGPLLCCREVRCEGGGSGEREARAL